MEENKKIGRRELLAARALLEEYRRGKTALESRIIEDDRWYRLRHWDGLKRRPGEDAPASAWLFNSLLNKHGDMMDNIPSPVVLPREEGDREDAKLLSAILPVVLERSRFESVYARNAYPKLQHGTACYGVFWDSALENGLGDIVVKDVDPLSIFWEPGVRDLQDSRALFVVSEADTDRLTAQYPALKRKAPGRMPLAQYERDNLPRTAGKTTVIDWYYKKPRASGGSDLHYCKFAGETLLYASENDENLAGRGFYDHGKYPFVLDTLFPIQGAAEGFGFVDVMKSPQQYIDELDRMILKNARLAGSPRWFVRDACGVNEEEFSDWSRDFVHVAGRMEPDDLRQIRVDSLPPFIANHRLNKVQELKETSGNRDISQGGVQTGVTAAAAIAALQEAGNKLSRDLIKGSYRAFSEICYLMIELIRQFYDEARAFRVLGDEFVQFSNAHLKPGADGRMPVFDVVVKPQRSNPFSQLSQNEQAKELYRLGFFRPDLADQALAALDLMQFEGIDLVRQRIAERAGAEGIQPPDAKPSVHAVKKPAQAGMIRARLERRGENLRLTVRGHAGYAPRGQDIVCAGVSTLVYALADALEREGLAPKVEMEAGRAEIEAGAAAKPLFGMAFGGLKALAGKYPNFIRVW